MKKYLIALIVFLSFLNVQAKDKTISFLINQDNVYYNPSICQEEDFVQTLNFSSGLHYTNTFLLKNDSIKEIPLYFFLESREQDGSYNDVLDYLSLKISLDDKVLYEDSASIMNYTNNMNLYDYISLGNLSLDESHSLTIELNVRDDFKNISESQFAYIYYSFYTVDKENHYYKITPFSKNDFYLSFSVWTFCITCIVIGIIILSVYMIIRRKEYRRIHKKSKKKVN